MLQELFLKQMCWVTTSSKFCFPFQDCFCAQVHVLSNSVRVGKFDEDDPGPFINDRNTMIALADDIIGLCVKTAHQMMEAKRYKNPLALYFIHTQASSCTEKTLFVTFPCLELATPLFHALNYSTFTCLEPPPLGRSS